MDIYYGYSVNGVAVFYIEILKNFELKVFYDFYLEKFNNKINGIIFCCWFMYVNLRLFYYLDEIIGEGWYYEVDEFEKFLFYEDKAVVKEKLESIKVYNKCKLVCYLKEY